MQSSKRGDVSGETGDFRWDDVRVVLALERAGSLSGAAKALGVNTSTVGRRLDALEANLGLRLFDRTPDGVLGTAALESLLPAAADLARAADQVSRAAAGLEREVSGVVRITAPPGVAQLLLAPRLPRLLRRHPGLRVQIDATIGYADLTRREADLALRSNRPTTGDLVALRVASVQAEILASPRLAKKLGALQDPNEARWVSWGPDLAHIPAASWLLQRVPAEQVVLRTSSMATQIAAVRAGLGLMLASSEMATAAGLTVVKLGRALRAELDQAPRGALWLVGHRSQREVPRVAAVWEFLRGEFDGEAAADD